MIALKPANFDAAGMDSCNSFVMNVNQGKYLPELDSKQLTCGCHPGSPRNEPSGMLYLSRVSMDRLLCVHPESFGAFNGLHHACMVHWRSTEGGKRRLVGTWKFHAMCVDVI